MNVFKKGALVLLLLMTPLNVEATQPVLTSVNIQPARNEKDITCLANAIYFEARGESTIGKTAVAQVIINRTKDERFPSTVCDVVKEKDRIKGVERCQFSWYCRKVKIEDIKLYHESHRIATLFINHKITNEQVKNALFFHSTGVNPRWKRKQVARIENHIYYE